MRRKFTKYPKKIVASKMSDIDLLAREALECTTKDELAAVISGLDSLGLRKLFLHYMEMLRDPSLSVPYIASQLSDELICYYSGKDVNACENVMASEICYRDRDNDDRVVALDVGMSDEDVEEMLAAHPSYYRSTLDRFDDVDACDNVMASSGIFYTDQGAGIGNRNQVFTEDDLRAAFNSLLAEGDPIVNSYDSFEAWRDATLDSGLLNVEFLDEDVENPDVEFDNIDIDATTEPKYFANMVSASIDDGDYDDEFLVEGYYDDQRRGLAESAETSDVSALNELIYEYANKGYYIVVHNLTDGVITEFYADNWFNDLARDGGAGLFMS